MTVYAISDLHLFHENILKWGRDQFKTTEEMANYIKERWNSVVTPQDKVYVLGDCFFGGRGMGFYKGYMDSLNGKKRLVVGNHDDIPKIVSAGIFQKVSLWRHFHEHNLLLTHVPIHEDCLLERAGDYSVNVHGHTHLNGSPPGPYFSVCCELVDYTPISLDEIRRRYALRRGF